VNNIVQTAAAAGNFKTLASALTAANLVDTLSGAGPYTVFAPTDAAFAKIPKADLDALIADTAKLKKVLTFHVVQGRMSAADVGRMKEGSKVKTVQGGELTVHLQGSTVKMNNSTVTATDIASTNGVIHAIDTVMMPS
jgi:uncharacterized surface protein with fasciclin (FAS1) repeats